MKATATSEEIDHVMTRSYDVDAEASRLLEVDDDGVPKHVSVAGVRETLRRNGVELAATADPEARALIEEDSAACVETLTRIFAALSEHR